MRPLRFIALISFLMALQGCGSTRAVGSQYEPTTCLQTPIEDPTTGAVGGAPAQTQTFANTRSVSVTGADNRAPGGPNAPSGSVSTAAMSLIRPANELTVRLLHELRDEGGNVFFSASSLRSALGMLALGARGETLEEMAHAMLLEREPSNNVAAAKLEASSWKRAAGNSDLQIVNRLWVQQGYPLACSFMNNTREGYGASAALLDFSGAPEPSRKIINQWAFEQTHGKIVDSLPSDSIGSMTRLVITNVIYFNGKWKEAFDTEQTKPGPFLTKHGDVTVPMMHKTIKMGYLEDSEVQVGSLSYRDSDLAMVIVLPQGGRRGPLRRPTRNTPHDGAIGSVPGMVTPNPNPLADLAKVEAGLTAKKLELWSRLEGAFEVYVTLPRFTFTWGRSIERELNALGLRRAFEPGADFSALTPKALSVDSVIQKTFVLVDEVGTQAAAVTQVTAITQSMPLVYQLKVDRPFLFFIVNRRAGDVLFAGRVVEPSAGG